ncbi:hypothetical protein Tco_0780096 [Tanacetum coccineum]
MQKESVSKQGRKPAKSEPTVHKDLAFDDLDDAMDYIETEDAHDEGIVKDNEETKVSIDKLKVSTDKPNEGTTEPNEGTAKPKDGNSDESAAPTTVFRDDETIAQFLVTMSQNKTKQKGFKIKDTDRPRTTTERSILTLKPLPKIDPKDKGKKVLEDSQKGSRGMRSRRGEEELAEEEATKVAFTNKYDFIEQDLMQTRFLLRSFKKTAREKVSTTSNIEQEPKYKHTQLNKKKFEEMQVMYEKVKRANENFIPISFAKDEKSIEKINKKAAGMDKEGVSKKPESTNVKVKIEEPKENIRKRSGRRLKMKAPKRSKRQKTDS